MVRDIDKLRARSEFRLGPRHLTLIIVATAVGGGVLFAGWNAFAGDRGGSGKKPGPDPLAALEASRDTATRAPAPAPAPAPPPATEEIQPLRLSFHERLGAGSLTAGEDDGMAPLPADEAVVAPGTRTAAAPAPAPPVADLRHNIPVVATPTAAPPAPAPMPQASPAARPVAAPPPAGPAASARPLPPGDPNPFFQEEATPDLAQPGEQGIFTLQVASYEAQSEAAAFMNVLRQRGHTSFLVKADGGDRGTIWRVRVGPFPTQREAERYRRSFERTERIPTFVVRRRLPVADGGTIMPGVPPTS